MGPPSLHACTLSKTITIWGRQSHAEKRINYRNLKWTFKDSLPCYCYAGAQPALHFGVEHLFSRNFIRWRHRANSTVVQLFRKRWRHRMKFHENCPPRNEELVAPLDLAVWNRTFPIPTDFDCGKTPSLTKIAQLGVRYTASASRHYSPFEHASPTFLNNLKLHV